MAKLFAHLRAKEASLAHEENKVMKLGGEIQGLKNMLASIFCPKSGVDKNDVLVGDGAWILARWLRTGKVGYEYVSPAR